MSGGSERVRDASLDVLSGAMVAWMLLHHLVQWSSLTGNVAYHWALGWLFFFMPWFFFKAGMVFRPVQGGYRRHTGKVASRLLRPLAVWFAIGYLVGIPALLTNDGWPVWRALLDPAVRFLRYGSTVGNDPLWFLLSLFWVQLVAPFLWRGRLFWIVAAPLAGWFLQSRGILLPLGLSTVPLGVFFFLVGGLYAPLRSSKAGERATLLASVLFLAANPFAGSYVDLRLNELQYGGYLAFCSLSVLAMPLALAVAQAIDTRWLAWMGRNSMQIYVVHWPVFAVMAMCVRIGGLATSGPWFALLLGAASALGVSAVVVLWGGNRFLFGR